MTVPKTMPTADNTPKIRHFDFYTDEFDQQLQAYKDAGNSLTSAKSGVEMATASMHEAKDKLSEASDKANTVTKAIEAYIGKVKDITVRIHLFILMLQFLLFIP